MPKKLKIAEYNPARFSAVTFRITNPKSTALLFSSGKVVCTGTRCKSDAILACYRYVLYLREKMKIKANIYDLTVQNIVSSVNLIFPVDLDKFAQNNTIECNYDPSLFPGAIWRSNKQDNSMVVLIFNSGRMVITGAKKICDINATYDEVLPLVTEAKVDENKKTTTTTLDVPRLEEMDDIMNKLAYEGVIGGL